MATSDIELQSDSDASMARKLGRLGWQAIRLPLLASLIVVEPVARFVLTAVALLGILASFVFEYSGVVPRFPFWLVFGISVGCGALLLALNAVMRRLAR
jgi:hypothetical protein